MKSLNASVRLLLTALSLFAITLIGCKGKPTDSEILASINEKIATKDEMKGLTANVSNGVVTLTGECPTEECRKDCADQVKKMNGVKDVQNNIAVASAMPAPAPVEIAADETLKSKRPPF